jgi:hypothetical protein
VEGYFQVCASEDVGNIGGFFAYISETGLFLFRCSGCFLLCRSMGWGFVRFDGEGILLQDVVDDF